MKLRNFRSVVTVAMSDEHNTPRPPAPLAQCSTVPPGKCPPQRISVTSGRSFRVSPFHNWMDGSGRIIQRWSSVMKVDRDPAERVAPFHHCCIEVRVRYTDSLQATERIDQGDGRRVQHRDAVPQDVSIGCANNQRALADRKGRLCPNANHSRLVL